MKRLFSVIVSFSIALLWALSPAPARADSSHARIVRLSLVQGDVRFARDFHKDSLSDTKAIWEIAPLNLPIRQGYAVATDSDGRAEVEFENGAMAFLGPNSLVEFYDLSMDDGAHITRLILRQGSAIFYVHPDKDDYFSVTGGDFSVEANGRSRFRLDNFDDGSTLNVEQGRVGVLRGNKAAKPLEMGQSYSVNVNDPASPVTGRAGDADDFDKWVSGRIDSVATATNYSNQYVNSPDYTSGVGDLYNYGNFYNLPGYGYGWQPFGAGLGWNPFSYGSWYSDPYFGMGFISSAPWGWLPYHFGGWVFSPAYGWLWVPNGLGFGGPVYYRPVTGVWVRSGTAIGVVPIHPADGHGKTPINLAQGVYALQGNTIAAKATPATGESWSVVKNPPHGAISSTTLATTSQPTRVSRTILTGDSGSRPITLSRDSSIVYDAGQHRFVNGKEPAKVTETEAASPQTGNSAAAKGATSASVAGGSTRNTNVVGTTRGTAPARPNVTPPSPPASGSSHSSGGAIWGHSGGSATPGTSSSSTRSSHSSGSSSGGHSSGGHH